MMDWWGVGRWADEWMNRQADVYMTDGGVMEGPLPQQAWSGMTLDTHRRNWT